MNWKVWGVKGKELEFGCKISTRGARVHKNSSWMFGCKKKKKIQVENLDAKIPVEGLDEKKNPVGSLGAKTQ